MIDLFGSIFASLLQDKDLHPEEDRSNTVKCRQDFCIHAGIGETVYPICLSQLRSLHEFRCKPRTYHLHYCK